MESLLNNLEISIRIVAGATGVLMIIGTLLYFKLSKNIFELKKKIKDLENKNKD